MNRWISYTASALLAAVVIANCDRTISARLPEGTPVVISNIAPVDLQKDPFTIIDPMIEDAQLNMTVVSGGGCRDHIYTLTMTPAAFMESFPVQANIFLWHDGMDDPCDAIVTDSVSFDLTPILELYTQMYGHTGQVNLNLYNFEQTESTRLVLKTN